MKKSLIIMSISLLILSVFSGCQKKELDYDIDNSQNQIIVDKLKETEPSTVPIISSDENSQGEIVLVNQKELNWATYEDFDEEIPLESNVFTQTGASVRLPNWEIVDSNSTIIASDKEDYFAVTIIENGTTDNIANFVGNNINAIHVFSNLNPANTESKNINGIDFSITTGYCDQGEYISYVGETITEQYCLVALIGNNSDRTMELMTKTIENILESVYMIGEDVSIEENQ